MSTKLRLPSQRSLAVASLCMYDMFKLKDYAISKRFKETRKIDPGIMDMTIIPRVENPEANRKWNDDVIDARRAKQTKSSSKN